MTTIKNAASEFLAHKRVAVTGVSRQPRDHGSNVVYKRLRERGYQVFAVNPIIWPGGGGVFSCGLNALSDRGRNNYTVVGQARHVGAPY